MSWNTSQNAHGSEERALQAVAKAGWWLWLWFPWILHVLATVVIPPPLWRSLSCASLGTTQKLLKNLSKRVFGPRQGKVPYFPRVFIVFCLILGALGVTFQHLCRTYGYKNGSKIQPRFLDICGSIFGLFLGGPTSSSIRYLSVGKCFRCFRSSYVFATCLTSFWHPFYPKSLPKGGPKHQKHPPKSNWKKTQKKEQKKNLS